jgi:hypothetical protein
MDICKTQCISLVYVIVTMPFILKFRNLEGGGVIISVNLFEEE